MLRRRILPAFGLLLLSGCVSDRIEPRFVAERWSTTLSAFNIDAVFPPREIQVGEVYLTLEPPTGSYADADRFKRRTIRLGRVDVKDAIRSDMQMALNLPPTAGATRAFDIFSPHRSFPGLTRTAYPGFNIAEFTEADLGVAWPVQVLRAVLGMSGRHDLVASISIPNAEDVQLSAFDAYEALQNFCAPPKSQRVLCDARRNDMRVFMESIREPGDPPDMVPKILMVTHVFYARQIDYAYTTQGGAALSLTVAVAASSSGTGGSSTGSQSPQAGGPSQEAGGGGQTNMAMSDAQRQADVLGRSTATAVSGLETGASPGANLKVVYASANGTVLRQTFDQPIAIGFRGLWVYPDGVAPPEHQPGSRQPKESQQ